jgi:putative ABC transport system permease protein
MIKNYFKIALQNLRKNPGFSLINIGGLGIGIACCLLIFQYVAFEYSFDEFHENAGDIYHISWARIQNEGEPVINASTGYLVGPTLAEETPEVLRFARIHPEYASAVISNPVQPDKTFEETRIYYVDSQFFQMFTFPLVSGNPGRALEPGTLLLSQSAAKKYLPNCRSVLISYWFRFEPKML